MYSTNDAIIHWFFTIGKTSVSRDGFNNVTRRKPPLKTAFADWNTWWEDWPLKRRIIIIFFQLILAVADFCIGTHASFRKRILRWIVRLVVWKSLLKASVDKGFSWERILRIWTKRMSLFYVFFRSFILFIPTRYFLHSANWVWLSRLRKTDVVMVLLFPWYGVISI